MEEIIKNAQICNKCRVHLYLFERCRFELMSYVSVQNTPMSETSQEIKSSAKRLKKKEKS